MLARAGRHPATQSLVSEFFLGDIVGVKDKSTARRRHQRRKGVDPSTISLRSSATCLIPVQAHLPTSFVVDPSQVGGSVAGETTERDNNWTRHPNGTGPYKLDQWRLGERSSSRRTSTTTSASRT